MDKDAIEVREDPDRQLEDVEELTEGAKLTGDIGLEACVGKGLKVGKGGYTGVRNDDGVGEFGGANGLSTGELLEL